MKNEIKSLEKYLLENYEKNIIDHRIRASRGSNGQIKFYIHADGKDSETLDFVVNSNQLSPDTEIKKG